MRGGGEGDGENGGEGVSVRRCEGGVVAARQLGIRAVVLGLDVLALGLVKLAAREIVGHDSDVEPPRRVPVWVVVALLGTLLARVITAWVLPRGGGSLVVVDVLVGRIQTLVALAGFAIL